MLKWLKKHLFRYRPHNPQIPDNIPYDLDLECYVLTHRGITCNLPRDMVEECFKQGIEPFENMREVIDEVVEMDTIELNEDSGDES